jgi:integrase/recombinase XerC
MSEITPINAAKYLPAIGEYERNARNAIALWLAGFRSPNTRRAYERELQAFASFLRRSEASAADVLEVTSRLLRSSETDAHKAVDAWRAKKIKRGNQPATINRSMAALNSFVSSARRGGFTTLRLDAKGEKTVPYRDTRGPGLPVYLRMLDVARRQADKRRAARDTAILQLAFGLALRRAEIAALNVGDVDLESGRLMIVGKGRAEPTPLTLTEELKEALGDWLRYRRASSDTDPLFVSVSRAGKDGRLTGDGIYKIVKGYGDRVGARARPHGIRHSAITEALSRVGGDFRKVRAFSRHSSINIVAVYDDNRSDHGGEVAAILTGLTRA